MKHLTIFGLLVAATLTVGCDLDLEGGIIGLPDPGKIEFCGGQECPTLSLTGQVTEGEGTPVDSVIVSTFGGIRADTTDAEGRYSLDWTALSLECGDWPVTAAHPNGQVQTDTVRVCSSDTHDFKF